MRAYWKLDADQKVNVDVIFIGKEIELPVILELVQDFKGSGLELKVDEFFNERQGITFYSIRPVNAAIKAVEMTQDFNQGQYRLFSSEINPESRIRFVSSEKFDEMVALYFRPK